MFAIVVAAIIFAVSPARAVESGVPVHASIIGYQDTLRICQEEPDPPNWCPGHMLEKNRFVSPQSSASLETEDSQEVLLPIASRMRRVMHETDMTAIE